MWPSLAAMRAAVGKPGGKVIEHTTGGKLSLAGLAAAFGTSPATVLRLTADHFPAGYPAPVTAYLNGVFGGTIKASEPMPKGLVLYLPA